MPFYIVSGDVTKVPKTAVCNIDRSQNVKDCCMKVLENAVNRGCEAVALSLENFKKYGFSEENVQESLIFSVTEFLAAHEIAVYLCVQDKKEYRFSKELYDEIEQFVECGTFDETDFGELCLSVDYEIGGLPPSVCKSSVSEDLRDYMKDKDKSFAFKLFDLIDRSGMTDVECYKKANVDKKTFSKIKCNPDTYRPSKQTAVAFAIALMLDVEKTQELLASAGLTLSESFTFDRIIRFFIMKGNYNIFEINEALFEFDQMLLGC